MRIWSVSTVMPLISDMAETSTTELGEADRQCREKIRAARQNLATMRSQHMHRFIECPGPEIQSDPPNRDPQPAFDAEFCRSF